MNKEPWMYVALFTAGCVAGNAYPKVEKAVVEDINQMRAARGLPPMVGSNAWIRYRPPEGDQDIVK